VNRSTPTTVVAAVILIMAGTSAAARASGAQATPPTKPSATAFDACALVTKQEATTVLGEAAGEPKPISADRSAMPGVNASACEYQSATTLASVQVYVTRLSSDSTGEFYAQLLRQTYQKECATKEKLSGLGEVACWNNSDHRELRVLNGTNFLIIRLKGGNATEALTTVAKKVLARLP
jgi:hypothetical protein